MVCYKKNFANELFDPIKVIEYLIDKDQLDGKLKKEMSLLWKKTSEYLYDDALDFLEFLKKQNCSLVLLTYGDLSYQTMKIEKAGIREYFVQIIITSKLKAELGLDYRGGIFIDDDKAQIEALMAKGAKVIRIRRKGNKHSLEDIANICEYENLNDLQRVIANNNF